MSLRVVKIINLTRQVNINNDEFNQNDNENSKNKTGSLKQDASMPCFPGRVRACTRTCEGASLKGEETAETAWRWTTHSVSSGTRT